MNSGSSRRDPALTALSILVRGRVQGVGFRYSALHEARRIGLSGWVRNTPGGDVEIWSEGIPEKQELFLKWLHRGPPGARVDSLTWDARPPRGIYQDFSVEY
jgi:acylphosphatase